MPDRQCPGSDAVVIVTQNGKCCQGYSLIAPCIVFANMGCSQNPLVVVGRTAGGRMVGGWWAVPTLRGFGLNFILSPPVQIEPEFAAAILHRQVLRHRAANFLRLYL